MAHYDSLSDAVKGIYADIKASMEGQFGGLDSSHFLIQQLHHM